MTASVPEHSLSWDRVLPAPHALLNGGSDDTLPRRSSSLLQHHLVSSRDLMDSSKERRSTVPSLSYHVEPSINPYLPSTVHSPHDSSASHQPASSGPLTRKRGAILMANETKSKETSPASAHHSVSEANSQFCLCQPDPKIPRPRNAFILYRQHHQAAVVAKHPGLPNPEISKIIGEEWRALPTKTKNQWKALAEEEKLRHQQQYPDYRYQPRRLGRNGTVQNTSVSSSTGPSGNCLRCGGRTMNPPTTTPHTPAFPPNEGPAAGMMRSPSTVNATTAQTPRRPHPLAHASLQRQVPYSASSPPPPGSALTRVRPFGEVFAAGPPTSMSEAEYRARFASQPVSPDPKRRRYNGPGVMVPGRTMVDAPSPSTAYPRGHPNSPRRVSLPRPGEAGMHPVHPRAVPQAQTQRPGYPLRQPRYASVDSRDPSLTLAPLRSPPSATDPRAPDGQKRTGSGATAEAQIMSIPAVNKLRLLAKAAPPLAYPGAVTKLNSSDRQSTADTRGAILAIEGSEEDVRVVSEWLAEFLRNEGDEFVVQAFSGPDISAVVAGAKNEQDANTEGTTQQRYLQAISEWHGVSQEVVKFVTSASKPDDAPAVAAAQKATTGPARPNYQNRKAEGGEGEMMDMDADTVSEASAVSPRTITQTERLSIKSPVHSNTTKSAPVTTATTATTATLNPPPSSSNPTHSTITNITTTTTPNHNPPSLPPRFPIALLPRYQLSTVDTAALIMPITDSYLPIDHWQWAAALWRGCVGADVTIVIQDNAVADRRSVSSSGAMITAGGSNSNEGGGGGSGSAAAATAGVEVRLGPGDVRAVIVRKAVAGWGAEQSSVIEAGALRRVGFEIVEFLRR